MTLKMTVKNNHRAPHPKNSASLVTLYGGGNEIRLVMIAFTVSLICHCIIFSLLIYAQPINPNGGPHHHHERQPGFSSRICRAEQAGCETIGFRAKKNKQKRVTVKMDRRRTVRCSENGQKKGIIEKGDL